MTVYEQLLVSMLLIFIGLVLRNWVDRWKH